MVPGEDLGSDHVLDEEHVDSLERDRLDLLDVALQRLLVGDGVADVNGCDRGTRGRVRVAPDERDASSDAPTALAIFDARPQSSFFYDFSMLGILI